MTRTRCLGALAAAALAALLVWVVAPGGGGLWSFLGDEARLQAWLRARGAWAPAASLTLGTLKPLVPLLPGQALAVANGWLFGFWRGLLLSHAAVLLGSALALLLARRWGRAVVARCLSPARVARVDELASHHGGPFFFLIFLLPMLPDDLACWAIGLTRLPLLRTFTLLAVARLPGVAVAVWFGSHASGLGPRGWLWLAGLAVAAVGLYATQRRRLEAAARRWLERAERPNVDAPLTRHSDNKDK